MSVTQHSSRTVQMRLDERCCCSASVKHSSSALHSRLIALCSAGVLGAVAGYNTFKSPYYNDSHRAFRAKVREFVDTEITPFCAEVRQRRCKPRGSLHSDWSASALITHLRLALVVLLCSGTRLALTRRSSTTRRTRLVSTRRCGPRGQRRWSGYEQRSALWSSSLTLIPPSVLVCVCADTAALLLQAVIPSTI